MTDSRVGATSNMPGYRGVRGLTAFGRDLVRAMDASGVLVDLAHASERTFWDALEVHDRSRPAIVSHTGLKGVFDTPRNITDRQLKAIADTGGVVGIIAHSWALRSVVRRCTARDIVAHMEHAIRVAGDDFVALGNDWDGLIVTPPDMRTVDRLPLLVERMLGRGFAPERIRKILGLNFLRLLGGHSPTM
jgi:membrane dipeptidase